jgi:oligopeptide/dipeptide ABC transporter ATP-binding protein
LDGRELVGLSSRDLRQIRGKQIGMVFQDPLTSLNPFLTIGDQLIEPLLVHDSITRAEARRRAIELLEKVGIPDAAHRLGDYPHRFSGGMRQRVMIAMALISHPKVLIADEPTTALDATIQAQVLELFRHIQAEFGISILLITHNLGIVAGMAERVAVMYAGRVVEYATTAELFARPRHPYTLALLKAVPRMGNGEQALAAIGGEPPDLARLRPGCSFYDRCTFREEKCKSDDPPLLPAWPDTGSDHLAACWVHIDANRQP